MDDATNAQEFEIIGCHANRAGHASVTLRHRPTGATIAIHNVPFTHDYAESVGDECRRIADTAAEIGDRALAYLKSPAGQIAVIEDPAPGAAPNDAEPVSRFGQSTS